MTANEGYVSLSHEKRIATAGIHNDCGGRPGRLLPETLSLLLPVSPKCGYARQIARQSQDQPMLRCLSIAALAGCVVLGLGQRTMAQDIMTVGELLQHCRATSTLCAQDFQSSSISMAFLWGGNCIPPKLVRQQVDMAVLRWLVAHPELAQEDAPDGIADAVTSLWPCAAQ